MNLYMIDTVGRDNFYIHKRSEELKKLRHKNKKNFMREINVTCINSEELTAIWVD
jgi:hypothetical protein